jgi:hypothetical protein
MSEQDIAYRAILQRIDDMMGSLREMKEAQTAYARDSRDTAVRLERVLGKIDELSRSAESQKETQRQLDGVEVRLSMVEQSQRQVPEFAENHHEKRIAKLEHSQSRLITASMTIIVVVNLLIFIAREML